MNKKCIQLWTLMSLILTTTLFISCEENDSVKIQEVKLTAKLPEVMSGVSADGLTVKFTNKTSGMVKTEQTDAYGQITLSVEEGLYDIEVSGKKTYSQAINDSTSNTQEVNLIGMLENQGITATNGSIEVDLKISIPNKGWVIKEIYFSNSKTTSGSAYNKDQFIEIYNNTDSVMYADGISIAQTVNLTTSEINLYAREINQSAFVNTIYTIPGSGRERPVQPGKSILMAPQPINHKEINSNSIDLSISDFQWYDTHATLSIQVPEVPDMIKYYSYSASIWNLHNRGSNPILIFKANDMGTYVSRYTDIRKNKAGKDATAIQVPNEFILDAVETGELSGLTTKSLSASIDLGFTGCSASGSGKSVRRKVAEIKNGRVIYQDTNNSSVDFIQDATPQPKVFSN